MTTLHERSLIIDGLNFHGDGDPGVLRRAGVTAVNMTVSHFESDFEEAMDGMARWFAILAKPDSGWRLVRRAADIEACHADGATGLIMGWQNLRPVGDRLERLVMLHELGLRVAQLTYNRRTLLGDGCLEPEDQGLTAKGRDAIAIMNSLGMAIDLSHVGQRTSVEAATASTRPVLATHANARSVTPALRNKSDDAIRAIAESGGVIGVSIYGPMCWDGDSRRPPSLDDFMRHLDHVVTLAGIDHVGIGTDLPAVADSDTVNHITAFTLENYPAAIRAYAEAFSNRIEDRYLADCRSHGDLHRITDRLLGSGWGEADIAGLLGGNFLRAFRANWG